MNKLRAWSEGKGLPYSLRPLSGKPLSEDGPKLEPFACSDLRCFAPLNSDPFSPLNLVSRE